MAIPSTFYLLGSQADKVRNIGSLFVNDVEYPSGTVAVEVGNVLKFEANPGNIFKFARLRFEDSGPFGGYQTVHLNLNEDKTVASITHNIASSDWGLYPTVLLEIEQAPQYSITVTQIDINNAIANKATIYVEGEEITEPTVVNKGEEIKLVADFGWEFYERSGPNSVRIRYTDPVFGGFSYEEFDLSPDKKEATIIVNNPPTSGYEYDRILVQTTQSAIEVAGTNNVYLVTNEKIRDVNNERFRTRLVTDGSQTEIEFFDYGDYILNILRLPFSLEDLVLEEEFINLGDRTLQTKAPAVATDSLTVDMGTINILGDGDSLDYQDVRTVLHLPWLSKVMIDASYVINHTISIEYIVDMYTGDTVANIYSTAVGDKAFLTVSGSIGFNIPFASYITNTQTPDNKGINTTGNNNLRKAYIEVIKSDAPLKDEFFNASVSDAGVLTNESGYLEISNANLQFKALHTEKLDIINILRNGIIV